MFNMLTWPDYLEDKENQNSHDVTEIRMFVLLRTVWQEWRWICIVNSRVGLVLSMCCSINMCVCNLGLVIGDTLIVAETELHFVQLRIYKHLLLRYYIRLVHKSQ